MPEKAALSDVQREQGAQLAGDGIPLQFGDLRAEYDAARQAAVLLDRSHEGRIELLGRDALAIPHRMSTHDLESLKPAEVRPTLFTNPTARILDRATFVRLDETRALALTEPGRGPALMSYLQRNIFFNDDLRLRDLILETHAFALHGPTADALMTALHSPLAEAQSAVFSIAGAPVTAARLKPLVGGAWALIVPRAEAGAVWAAVSEAGAPFGLRPAGSLTYNVLRIEAGRPGVGRELSSEYIPLEVGLWDEVSFSKGCYTGQEIIARMESRGRLARTMMRVTLSAALDAPAPLTSADGKAAGTLTSAVKTPDGRPVGIAVVRMAYAQPGTTLLAGPVEAHLTGYAGAQPPGLREEDES